MIALEEGLWGGALNDVVLPFEVDKSENPIGTIEQECVVKTGCAFTIDDEVKAPFAVYGLNIEGMDYKFLSMAAKENGPGTKCEISDISEAFSLGLFRSDYSFLLQLPGHPVGLPPICFIEIVLR